MAALEFTGVGYRSGKSAEKRICIVETFGRKPPRISLRGSQRDAWTPSFWGLSAFIRSSVVLKACWQPALGTLAIEGQPWSESAPD